MYNLDPLTLRYKIATGDTMRVYQLSTASRIVAGVPIRHFKTGTPMDLPYTDGNAAQIDMGLGKTIAVLTAIVELFRRGIIKKPVLVIAPIKVCESVWRQEAAAWSHTKELTFELIRGVEKTRAFSLYRQAHIYLINPELLNWLSKYLRHDWSMFDMLVIDEISAFKNPRSVRFKSLTRYGSRGGITDTKGKLIRCPLSGSTIPIRPHRFKRTVTMTGTPSPSGLLNIWTAHYILDHGSRLHTNYDTYKSRFFHKTVEVADHVFKHEINTDEDQPRPDYKALVGAPERIHEIVADVTIELSAADYGVLPEQRIIPHYLELPDSIRERYKSLERDALIELSTNTVIAQNGGAKSMMCWQICNGAIHATNDDGSRYWELIHNVKTDYLVELIGQINNNSLIPYYFTHDLERIVSRFKEESINYAVLGSKNSQKVIDAWNAGDIHNLLIHPQSASHGINLQFGGFNIIWFTMVWSLERFLQTNARLARSGQGHPVAIHQLIMDKTTDTLMEFSLESHGTNQERFRKALAQYQKLIGIT